MFSKINDKHGFVPLSQVRHIRTHEGRETVVFDDELVQTMAEVEGRGMLATVVEITSVTGEWEALTNLDGTMCVHPVLVWGLTAEGLIVPVTAAAPGGVHLLVTRWGVRPLHSPHIYLSDGTVCGEADFLDRTA